MWPDVGHHTILIGPRYKGLIRDIFIRGKLAEDMSLYVHRPSVTDPGVAPVGGDTFYALSPVPHLGHANPSTGRPRQSPTARRCRRCWKSSCCRAWREHLAAAMVFTPDDFRDRYLCPMAPDSRSSRGFCSRPGSARTTCQRRGAGPLPRRRGHPSRRRSARASSPGRGAGQTGPRRAQRAACEMAAE